MRYLIALAEDDLVVPGALLADRELSREPAHVTIVGAKDDPAAQALYAAARTYPTRYLRIEWLDRREGPLPAADIDYPEMPEAAAFACANGACSVPVFAADEVHRHRRQGRRPLTRLIPSPSLPRAGALRVRACAWGRRPHCGRTQKFPIRGPMEPMLKGAAPQAAPADLIKDSDQTKFAKDVLEASRTVPVIVDFWAPWCGPCKQLQPAIEKVVKAANGAVKLVKINIDENQMLAQQLRIQSIPAVYAFFGGRPVDGFMGAVPESQIKQFVDRLMQAERRRRRAKAGDELAELLEHAKAARGAERPGSGRRASTARSWASSRPTSRRSAGMARYHVQAGDLEQAKELLGQVAGQGQDQRRRRGACRPRSISPRRPRKPGPVDDLKAKAAADPKDMQARLDLAHGLLGGQPAPGSDRRAARHDQGRPQVERGGRPPAAPEVLRGAGLHRSARRRRPQAAVDHPVLLMRRGRA